MAIKNGANAPFSVQSKIFPKLKTQMRYQNVQEGSNFTVEREKILNFQVIIKFSLVKDCIFFSFFKA